MRNLPDLALGTSHLIPPSGRPLSGGAKLGSFRTISSVSRSERAKLGSFRTVHSPGGPPHTTTAFAHIPQSLQVWLRFAHFAPAPAPDPAKLGSFCTFGLRRPPTTGVSESAIRNPKSEIEELGLFRIIVPRVPARLLNWLCLYNRLPTTASWLCSTRHFLSFSTTEITEDAEKRDSRARALPAFPGFQDPLYSCLRGLSALRGSQSRAGRSLVRPNLSSRPPPRTALPVL
jgi:hypothetical protein